MSFNILYILENIGKKLHTQKYLPIRILRITRWYSNTIS